MLLTVVCSVAAVVAAGLGLKWWFDTHPREGMSISLLELVVEATLMTALVAPATAYVGKNLARSNLLTFHEYWNGWELKAVRYDTTCHEDGQCYHTYDCDPYLVPVSCGKNGEDTCLETRYRSCPYVKVESAYAVETTLGTFEIAIHRFPDNPNEHRWRAGHHIPGYIIERAGTGIPAFWLAAQRRIKAGDPGPVTVRKSYANYIYASDKTNLKQYSSDVAQYLKQSLLPPVSYGVHDFYEADKVHFVGFTPGNSRAWQDALARLSSALGSELQGDLQLVIVQDAAVTANADAYALALKAYWQDTSVFGKNAFSKNGIGVIAGTTDGTTVAWARAFTGMPLGNEALVTAIQSELTGVSLTPEALIGAVHGHFQQATADTNASVVAVHSDGALASIIWGQRDPATKFARVSMSGNGPSKNGGGFLYLASEIQPTPGQQLAIISVVFVLGLMGWFVCAMVDGDELLRQLPSNLHHLRKGLSR